MYCPNCRSEAMDWLALRCPDCGAAEENNYFFKSRTGEEEVQNDIAQKEIHLHSDSVRIIAHKGAKEVFVDIDKLTWREEEEGQLLTLGEISTQLNQLGYERVYYVWIEMGLSGVIYQYGNYEPPSWQEHGKTRGFA